MPHVMVIEFADRPPISMTDKHQLQVLKFSLEGTPIGEMVFLALVNKENKFFPEKRRLSQFYYIHSARFLENLLFAIKEAFTNKLPTFYIAGPESEIRELIKKDDEQFNRTHTTQHLTIS